MKIRFLEDVELDVIEEFDELTEDIKSSAELFKAGTVNEIDVFSDEDDEDAEHVDIQFGNGSVCFGVMKSWFEVVNEN